MLEPGGTHSLGTGEAEPPHPHPSGDARVQVTGDHAAAIRVRISVTAAGRGGADSHRRTVMRGDGWPTWIWAPEAEPGTAPQ